MGTCAGTPSMRPRAFWRRSRCSCCCAGRRCALRWADGSFAAGALAALGVGLWAARDWGEGRMGSAFLNPIHFGDIALILGVLSALSINWWRKDPLTVRLLKVGGLLAGLVASLLTGSRGGWVALPFILLLVAVARGRDKPARWRVLVPAVAVLGVAVLYAVSGTIHERIHMVWVDLAQYAQGQKDTSIGIRLQIYQAALMLIPKHPIFGLGPGGFADSLQALVDAGRMSATAAQLGAARRTTSCSPTRPTSASWAACRSWRSIWCRACCAGAA